MKKKGHNDHNKKAKKKKNSGETFGGSQAKQPKQQSAKQPTSSQPKQATIKARAMH